MTKYGSRNRTMPIHKWYHQTHATNAHVCFHRQRSPQLYPFRTRKPAPHLGHPHMCCAYVLPDTYSTPYSPLQNPLLTCSTNFISDTLAAPTSHLQHHHTTCNYATPAARRPAAPEQAPQHLGSNLMQTSGSVLGAQVVETSPPGANPGPIGVE